MGFSNFSKQYLILGVTSIFVTLFTVFFIVLKLNTAPEVDKSNLEIAFYILPHSLISIPFFFRLYRHSSCWLWPEAWTSRSAAPVFGAWALGILMITVGPLVFMAFEWVMSLINNKAFLTIVTFEGLKSLWLVISCICLLNMLLILTLED